MSVVPRHPATIRPFHHPLSPASGKVPFPARPGFVPPSSRCRSGRGNGGFPSTRAPNRADLSRLPSQPARPPADVPTASKPRQIGLAGIRRSCWHRRRFRQRRRPLRPPPVDPCHPAESDGPVQARLPANAPPATGRASRLHRPPGHPTAADYRDDGGTARPRRWRPAADARSKIRRAGVRAIPAATLRHCGVPLPAYAPPPCRSALPILSAAPDFPAAGRPAAPPQSSFCPFPARR
ncbi:MAG: hypothetical protein BWY57_02182 [Betaproteobacteria bacterium ADurb.Bin341]|nr:MAG: hypothetical protein BWY57_02182 [Betaproteobacteria bacterium ADurb.Bin341]